MQGRDFTEEEMDAIERCGKELGSNSWSTIKGEFHRPGQMIEWVVETIRSRGEIPLGVLVDDDHRPDTVTIFFRKG